MSEPASMPPLLNKSMKMMLRSPLHGVVSNYLTLITFTGRKSGKTYTTPVSYSEENGLVTIFTHAKWWKNLHKASLVTLCLKGKEVQGIAEAVEDDKPMIANALISHLRKSPFDARYYDVTIDENGNPNPDEVEQAVQTVAMIRVWLR